MDILPKDIDNPETESGAILNGVTWVFYKMTIAVDTISPAADAVIAYSKILHSITIVKAICFPNDQGSSDNTQCSVFVHPVDHMAGKPFS